MEVGALSLGNSARFVCIGQGLLVGNDANVVQII